MAKSQEIKINNFAWGISKIQTWEMKDNQLQTAKNMCYNNDKQLITRYWYFAYLPKISTKPVTSYFFHQRDDGNGKFCLAVCGDVMYSYDESSNTWITIKTWLTEFETNPNFNGARTRRDFAVYNNIVYMCNGVDSYASFSWITPAYLTWGTSATSVVATWNAVTNGSFNITIDWTVRSITGLNFAGAVSMSGVASIIQAGIRAVTWSTETCMWSTNKFIISSVLKTLSSAITVTSATGSGTDISWAWATAFMDSETWRGTVTNVANTYTEYSSQPKCRYISYLWDRIYGAGEDANPITIYYTAAVPANANTLNANFIKVWGDETGAINAISELGNVVLAIKDSKNYAINPVEGTATQIDSQGGWFANKSVKNVGNSIVFFNEKGIDTLKQRNGVTGTTALETTSISDDVASIFWLVQKKNFNFQCGMYNRIDGKYYVSIDSNNDTIPDMMMVYSSVTGSWTSYDLPSMFDMWIYIDNSQNTHYLFAWTDGQLYEFDSWSQDYSQDIQHEVLTKKYGWDPGKVNTYNYIDIIWYKSVWTTINADIYSEDVFQTWWTITDANIDYSVWYKTIWSKSLASQSLSWNYQGDAIKLYQYTVRLSMYVTWSNISVGMKSSGWNRTIDRIRIGIEWQPIDVFYSNQYL